MTYLLFGSPDGYVEGGACDLIGVYASEAQARRAFGEEIADYNGEIVDYNWAHILLVDGLKAKIIRRYNKLGWRNARW